LTTRRLNRRAPWVARSPMRAASRGPDTRTLRNEEALTRPHIRPPQTGTGRAPPVGGQARGECVPMINGGRTPCAYAMPGRQDRRLRLGY
jgi:hypothetical protein